MEGNNVLFIELFSGLEARLTKCVSDAGFSVAQPQDLELGGGRIFETHARSPA